MTTESQRIVIAEVCGWTEIRQHPKTKVWFAIPPPERIPQHDVLLPDYLDSLDAMHEAVMTVIVRGKDIQQYRSNEQLFADALKKIVNREQVPVWHFTATLYAEAFLKTLNLWTE